MFEYGNRSAIATFATMGKLCVWLLVGLSAVVLLLFMFNMAPYVLAPLFNSLALQTPPRSIDGRMTNAQIRQHVAELRAITASPQAVANAARSLTIVGLTFDDLRTARLRNAKPGSGLDPLALPYPMALDLSHTNGNGVVALSQDGIAWSIVAPPVDAPRAIFGIEARVFPEIDHAPNGVLAGFRTTDTSYHKIAPPLLPDGQSDEDVRKFCSSVVEWAAYFSLPLSRVDYMLVEDATLLQFRDGDWTSSGRTPLRLDSRALSQACHDVGGRAWQ